MAGSARRDAPHPCSVRYNTGIAVTDVTVYFKNSKYAAGGSGHDNISFSLETPFSDYRCPSFGFIFLRKPTRLGGNDLKFC